jgi:hypothetical protein
MDGNDNDRRARRRWLGGAGLIVLLGLAAVGAAGEIPAGTGATRRPAPGLADYGLSVFVVLMAIGAVFAPILYGLFSRDAARLEGVRGRRRSSRDAIASTLGGLVLVAAAIVIYRRGADGEGLRGFFGALGDGAASGQTDAASYEPRFALVPVLVTFGLAGVAAAAVWLDVRARRRARGGHPPAPPSELVMAEILDEALDDLLQEQDARRAVIAAYARMEASLAVVGMPRRDTEAPAEYLERVVSDLGLSRRSAGRLTGLFAWARYSEHAVGREMQHEAIDTLSAVREELRAIATERAASAQPPGRVVAA